MYYYPQNNYGYTQNYQQQEPQRVQQVYQQNMVQQQNMTQQQIVMQGYPVPDEATARNAMVSTDGTISIFPDILHGRIYTKQLDMNTFAPIFKVYQIVEQPQQQDNTNYVCLEDFQKLQNYVSNLEMKINEMINLPKATDKKGVDKNVQSNANATK